MVGVPAGLTPVLTVNALGTTVTLTLTGAASAIDAENADDVANIIFTFANTAINTVPAANTSGAIAASSALGVNFQDTTLSYSVATFPEVTANDGSIAATSTITLAGDTFVLSSPGALFTPGVHYSVANVPAGLTPVITVVDSTHATVSFNGSVSSNLTNPADVLNFTIAWTNAAFTTAPIGNITNSTKADFVIDFTNQPSIAYAGNFTEVVANNGSVTGSRIATLTGGTFALTDGTVMTAGTHYTLANVPAGLTAVVTKTDATHATLTLTGNASPHLFANSVTALTITFLTAGLNTVSAANTLGYSDATGAVTFADQANIVWASNFTESAANDGSVTGSRTATITSDTFALTNGSVLTGGGVHYTISGVPAGLTAVLTQTSSTLVSLTFTGNASSHLAANNVSAITVTFANGIFTSTTTASNVTGYTNSLGTISFTDQPSITYAGAFTESIANDGSVTGSRIATLTGDTFVAGVAGFTTVTNAPAGLTPVVTFTDSTHVTVTLTGNASPHVLATSLANLTITFNNGAFTTTPVATNVTAYTNIVGTVTFIDQPSIAYAGNFTESLTNDGSVTGSRTATLTGDTYAATLTLG